MISKHNKRIAKQYGKQLRASESPFFTGGVEKELKKEEKRIKKNDKQN